MNVSFLSGYFIFIRTSILEKLGFLMKDFSFIVMTLTFQEEFTKLVKTMFYPYCEVFRE